MKISLLLLFVIIIWVEPVAAQSKKDVDYNLYTGLYQVIFLTNRKFNIYKDGDKLMVEIVGQGRTDLIYIGNNKFKANHVKPEAIIEFTPGNAGLMTGLKWTQKTTGAEWNKVAENNTDTINKNNSLSDYAGKYRLKGNPYMVFVIGLEQDHLTGNLENEDRCNLYPDSKDYFVFTSGDYGSGYRFTRDEKGKVAKMIYDQHGGLECVRVSPKPTEMASAKHNFYKRTNFTHADTLMGKLSALRTCYDVLFYHLDLSVFPASKSIKGSNLIRFKSINDFDEMQIDLFANMTINKIIYHNTELTYKRDGDAVFIKFPSLVTAGTTNEIEIFYEGPPQVLDLQIAHSGWIWYQNKHENPWIESVSQGSGASLWWPCKDHLSDKPDSMRLSITVPKGLMEISNGKLLSTTDLPGNTTRFDWYVSYPINNYNAVIYIGDYIHLSGADVSKEDYPGVNYYCLKDNLEKAKSFFTNVTPTLNLYEKLFGIYPFKKDGFSLVEAPYPMEHQGAVSMGSIYSPPNSNQFDSATLVNTLWHEMAHEWWGNSVTCKDYADFWIHESFATYAELLARKNLRGQQSFQKAINDTKPENKESVIGFYDVNDFHLGDMYPKGGLMLNTLQHIVDNDSVWFSMLQGIQEKFKFQSVTSAQLIAFINERLQSDYTYFFDQYLRYPAIPSLVLKLHQSGASLEISYQWEADVKDFRMPVKVTTKKTFEFIYPGSALKTMVLPNMSAKDFKVDTENFYMGVKYQKN